MSFCSAAAHCQPLPASATLPRLRRVDQLPQAAEAAAVEVEHQARQCDEGRFVFFFALRFADGEFAVDENVAER